MTKETFTVRSAVDGTNLSALLYIPSDKPKGIFAVVHGMTEHKDRYIPLMEYLCEKGFVVCAHDHRGHGDSVSDKADLGYFGKDKKGEAVVEDVATVLQEVKRRFADLPVVLYGHSMGSLIVRCYLQRHDEELCGLIVSGSPSENPMAGIGLAMNGLISLFKGERHRSATMANLTTGNGDKNFPGEGKRAWLTRDKAIRDKYGVDEKCNYTFTCNGFANLLNLIKHTYDKKRFALKNPTLPIFFIGGADDPVIGGADKFLSAQKSLKKIGYENVKGKLYVGMRHEVHNEIGKDEVWKDISDFALSTLKKD